MKSPAALPFEYLESPPPAEVAQVVHSLWGFRTTNEAPMQYEHTVWPDACVSLGAVVFAGRTPAFMCVPARTESFTTIVHRGQSLWGVRLWPDVGSLVLGLPAADIRPESASAFAAQGEDLIRRIARVSTPEQAWDALGAWATASIALRESADIVVRTAIRAIIETHGRISSAELARRATVGVRQLQRRFVVATGFTIKAYARVRRLRHALSLRMAERDAAWSLTAATAGYADQAHLSREFSSLAGLGPKRAAEHLERIKHCNVTP